MVRTPRHGRARARPAGAAGRWSPGSRRSPPTCTSPGCPSSRPTWAPAPAVAQLTLTAFLVAFAGGQLLLGPLSDAVGRRRLVLAGHRWRSSLASVLCAVWRPSAPVLLAARVLQGLAGAAGSVAGRAMVTDVLAGVRRAKVIASLSAINAVAPVVAPLIGGALLGVGTWRLTFWVLAGVGRRAVPGRAGRLPRDADPRNGAPPGVGLAASGRRMADLLRIPRFSLYLATSCVATVGFFAYIATSAFVFQTWYGYSAARYTLVFATNAACMILTRPCCSAASSAASRRTACSASGWPSARLGVRRRPGRRPPARPRRSGVGVPGGGAPVRRAW